MTVGAVAMLLIAVLFRAALLAPGSNGFVRFIARTPLPLLGEYVRLIRSLGYRVVTVDISEFEKLEGCVTCLSVLVR